KSDHFDRGPTIKSFPSAVTSVTAFFLPLKNGRTMCMQKMELTCQALKIAVQSLTKVEYGVLRLLIDIFCNQ
ncbi:MAG: hypothetical protein E7E28_00115, partial [Negativicoccus succinicivorans]|nr:hypothetical protein [Negativicoccus succinicivorans]